MLTRDFVNVQSKRHLASFSESRASVVQRSASSHQSLPHSRLTIFGRSKALAAKALISPLTAVQVPLVEILKKRKRRHVIRVPHVLRPSTPLEANSYSAGSKDYPRSESRNRRDFRVDRGASWVFECPLVRSEDPSSANKRSRSLDKLFLEKEIPLRRIKRVGFKRNPLRRSVQLAGVLRSEDLYVLGFATKTVD